MLSVLDNNHESKNIEESGLQQIALNESLENLLLDPDFDSDVDRSDSEDGPASLDK